MKMDQQIGRLTKELVHSELDYERPFRQILWIIYTCFPSSPVPLHYILHFPVNIASFKH